MARFALIAALLACYSAVTSAQCTPYADPYAQYSINLCPLTSTTPPALTNQQAMTFTSADSGVSPRVTLPFPIMFYGQRWDYISASTNGAVFFGPTPSTVSTSTLPVSGTYEDSIPVVAAYWADLYMLPGVGNSSITYGTTGATGSRQFIVRFDKMNWWAYRLNFPSTTASFDVVFYEQPAGKVEIIYYNVPPQPAAANPSTTIGIQSSDSMTAWTLVNGFTNFSTLHDMIHAKRLELTYIGETVDTVACGALGYNLNSLRGQQLQFSGLGATWHYAPCGEVTNSVCNADVTANKAMICMINGTEAYDLGTFGPRAFSYQFTPNSQSGLQAMIQTGEKCAGTGSFTADRFTIVNYVCDASATTPHIQSVANPAVCVYQIDVATSLVCGPGSRSEGVPEFPPSTLGACTRANGALYNAELCPRRNQRNVPMTLTAPTQVLVGGSSSAKTDVIPLQFGFPLYGEVYNSLVMTMNGGLYFNSPYTGSGGAAPKFGMTSTDTYPSILAFTALLSGDSYSGMTEPVVQYSHETINNVRSFVARYTGVHYSSFRAMYDMTLTFDVIIQETGSIQIRYYKVAPNPAVQVQIGIHGIDFDVYTTFVNHLDMDTELAFQLQGATLTYTYNGRNRFEACAAFGANFTNSITSDLVFQSGAYTYYINPCGTVSQTEACRAIAPASSICEVSSTGVGNSLTTFNPNAVTWSSSPAPLVGLRSETRDGRYCSSVLGPRRLTIDWLCDPTISQTTVVSVTIESTCVYNIQIYAQAACSSRASCANITDDNYNGEWCPSVQTMISLSNPINMAPLFTSLDSGAIRIPLPWNFLMYGSLFNYLWISVNGVVSFGTERGATTSPISLPMSGDGQNMLPAILGFWADLNLYATGNMYYSYETINNIPALVVRWYNVSYWNEVAQARTVTFDIILFSGDSGAIEIRYYNMMPSAITTKKVTAGLVADTVVDQLVLANYAAVNEVDVISKFNNSVVRLSYRGRRDDQFGCSALGYDLSSLRSNTLLYNDTVSRNFFNVRICGVVQNSLCGGGEGDRSMMCHGIQNTLGVVTTHYTTAVWSPRSSVWQYAEGANGLRLINSDGTYCATSARGRTTVFNFICDPTATTPRFIAALPRACIYQANITTSVVCGAGNRGTVVPPVPTRSTLTACQTIAGSMYEASWCPRGDIDLTNTPVVLQNPTRIMTSTGNTNLLIDIPFPFFLYGTPIDKFEASSEGTFFFGTGYTSDSTPQGFPNLGFTAGYFPVIAAFWTALTNVDNTEGVIPYTGFIEWASQGAVGSRQLIVRFSNVDYESMRENLFQSHSVSFDLVLTEGEPGGVEIRYYNVDPSPFDNIVIGMQGLGEQYTAVQNYVMLTSQVASQIRGSTLRYRYTGTSNLDFCGGVQGSIDLRNINQELNFNVSTYAYYFRPCGAVTQAKCVNNYPTSMATLCRAMTTTSTTTLNLATHAPGAITYSFPVPTTLRATYRSGALCSSAPRVTIVDYVCDQAATTAYITMANETTCQTYLEVRTRVACQAAPTCELVVGNLYNAQVCLAEASMIIPGAQTNPISVLEDKDDGVVMVDIPWEHKIYGSTSNNLWININGYISFGSVGSTIRLGPLPIGVSGNDAMPGVFAYMYDLYNRNANGTSNITYSFEGTAPNRHMVVRYLDLTYFATRPGQTTNAEKLLSFEFRLYETTGVIDVVYYKIEDYPTGTITVGIQSNDRQTWTAIQNNVHNSAAQYALEGKYIRWVYTGTDNTNNSTCGGLGYQFNSLMNHELQWRNETSNSTVIVNVCGIVANPLCASQLATERSMACAVIGTPTLTTYRNMGVYSPQAVTWNYLDNGVQFYSQNGAYCSVISGPSITFTDFICDTSATTPRLETVVLTENGCFNRIVIRTSLACGGGDRVNHPPESPDRPRVSTLSACFSNPGNNYTMTICPRSSSDPAYLPVTMTNPTTIMQGQDNAMVALNIGFDFYFYGMVYTAFNLSTNGYAQFGEGATNTGVTTALSGLSATLNNWPVIAAFWSDLINTSGDVEADFHGTIQYSNEGTAPNRKFIVRFHLVDYYSYRFYPGVTGVSFDLVLSEGESSDIEIRYYRVDPNPTVYAVAGIRADAPGTTQYTAYWNRNLVTAAAANELQGTTVKYHYTGIPASQACSAYGITLDSARGVDLEWTNTTSGRKFYHHVCGIVQNPTCRFVPATSLAGLCEVDTNGNRALFSATQFNPAAVAWTRLSDGLSLTQATGTYCSNISGPRVSTINYICDPSATTPVLASVSVVTCRYTARVLTNAVCQGGEPQPARSSSTGSNPTPTAQPTTTPTPTAQPTTTPTPTTTPGPVASSSGAAAGGSSSSSSSLSSGAIAGIVIGVVIGVLVLIAIIFFFFCMNRDASKSHRLEDEKSQVGSHGDVESRAEGEHNYTGDDEVEMTAV